MQQEKPALMRLNDLAKYNKMAMQWQKVGETGPPHAKQFTMQLAIGTESYQGTGSSVNRAKNQAAEICLTQTKLAVPVVKSRPNQWQNNQWNQFTSPFPMAGEAQKRKSESSTLLMVPVAEEPIEEKRAKLDVDSEITPIDADGQPPTGEAGTTPIMQKPPLMAVHELARFNNVAISFKIVNEYGPPHAKMFDAVLQLGEETYTATGTSHKKAQTACAEMALRATRYAPPSGRQRRPPRGRNAAGSSPRRRPFGEPPMMGPPPMAYGRAPRLPFEDRCVRQKHTELYPTDSELSLVQRAVSTVERALKIVSDQLMQKISPDIIETITDPEVNGDENKDKEQPQKDNHRVLRGVMRVGLLADGLLLRDDRRAELVLLCNDKPGRELLASIHQELADALNNDKQEDVTIRLTDLDPSDSRMLIYASDGTVPGEFEIILYASSPAFHQEPEAPDPPDMLDRTHCLEALTMVRRARWFHGGSAYEALPMVTRVLRSLSSEAQHPLNSIPVWMLQVLLQRCFNQAPQCHASPGLSLRVFMELLASGSILPGSHFDLADPCEKEPVDLLSTLTAQDRESLTLYGQRCVRQVAFKKIHEVLGIEPQQFHHPAAKVQNDNDVEPETKVEHTDNGNEPMNTV